MNTSWGWSLRGLFALVGLTSVVYAAVLVDLVAATEIATLDVAAGHSATALVGSPKPLEFGECFGIDLVGIQAAVVSRSPGHEAPRGNGSCAIPWVPGQFGHSPVRAIEANLATFGLR